MVCMLASRTCNRGSDAVRFGAAARHQIASLRPAVHAAGKTPRLILRRLGYLLGGRLGVRLGDRLNGSVILFIGI